MPIHRFKLLLFFFTLMALMSFSRTQKEARILVFTKTTGYRHESIPAGIEAVKKLGIQHGFAVDTTEDASKFNEPNLKRYSAVIFLSTTGDVLNQIQQADFERYIQAGGGYVGIHAAADTEYNWPWYSKLVGAYFLSHPKQQKATVQVTDKTHISTSFLPDRWERFDEWYNYKSINPGLKVLATLDEKTYEGGKNGDKHPIAWYHEYDGGRAFYTGGGHTNESYTEPEFLQHLLGGIQYVMGQNQELTYAKAKSERAPEENRFARVVLTEHLDEPMELAVAKDGRVFFIDRTGTLRKYDPATHEVKKINSFRVNPSEGNGLLGITLDPAFEKNNYVYLFYTHSDENKPRHQVSRFVLGLDSIDHASEKVLLEIPIELERSAHTGGSLTFDDQYNLFISVGDNTTPFESKGFAPIDEREGRLNFDAQRASGNTNDLRGKILKIHVEPNGTYTVPDGNLFPKDGSKGRPEIYVMGCRNPYRISYDSPTKTLYWGEIGPDSGQDGEQGPRGYDEFNQAKKPGNYGWPYFVGDNKAYKELDFQTNQLGETFNAEAPVNNSVNNTGSKTLPPAQKAMIWYPYAVSPEFPDLKKGGRSAMAGPVYHFDPKLNSKTKFPAYYDKALFIYDWMRNWIMVVRLDEQGNYLGTEPFMPSTRFDKPVDMEFGADGALYVLEYGEGYGVNNADASLVRIEYNPGNRPPVAIVTVSDSIGALPMKVKFSSERTYDFDGEPLTYEWKIGKAQIIKRTQKIEYTFDKPGIHLVILKVTDSKGVSAIAKTEIRVGNSPPKVSIQTTSNRSFYWDNEKLSYQAKATDKEDGTILPSKISVRKEYLAQGKDLPGVLIGHQVTTPMVSKNIGKELMSKSDCMSCHMVAQRAVGPSFKDVAIKYAKQEGATAKLANKVIVGGGGVWGPHVMSAHPQLTEKDAAEMVNYILSLGEETKAAAKLPSQGTVLFNEHLGKGDEGTYILTATYTDKGGQAVGSLTSRASLILRNPKVQAEDYDMRNNVKRMDAEQGYVMGDILHQSWLAFQKIDLKNIDQLTYRLASRGHFGTIEVRIDSATGPVISTVRFEKTGSWKEIVDLQAPIKDPGGLHDLYFVFLKPEAPTNTLLRLDWIYFHRKAQADPTKSDRAQR